MNRFFYWLADKLRPLHRDGLPEELAFPAIELGPFQRGHMLRSASLGLCMGPFEIIGEDRLKRAARAWRPRELHLMEDVSAAFHLVDEQRERAILVEPVHIDRLVETLHNYLGFIGERLTKGEIRKMVNDHLDARSDPNAVLASEAGAPVPLDHPLFEELRVVDEEMRQRFPGMFGGLGNLGLELFDEVNDVYYPGTTPNNCRSFAHTGGEGVHFSFLIVDGAITEDSPVVLTTPADMRRSQIVGANLHEFLCLGCIRGYFAMECLWEENLEPFLNSDWQMTDTYGESAGFGLDADKQARLAYLRERLTLRPWTDPARFTELQRQYMPLLQLPPDVPPHRTA